MMRRDVPRREPRDRKAAAEEPNMICIKRLWAAHVIEKDATETLSALSRCYPALTCRFARTIA